MTCKLTYFYRDITSSTDDGWSENFYIGSGSAAAALAVATAPGWLNERLGILSSSYMLSSIRAQNVVNRFDNARQRFNQQTGVGQYQSGMRAPTQGEAPWQGLLIRLLSGTDSNRSFILRGITTEVIGQNLEYQAPARFDPRVRQWAEDLAVAPNAYLLRKAVRTLNIPTPVSVTILGDLRTPQLTYAVGTAPVTLIRGTIVELKGSLGGYFLNGVWRVQSNDTTNVRLFPKRKNLYGTYTPPTAMAIITYIYPPITDFEIIRGAERKAGRPSDQLRGRASGRRT